MSVYEVENLETARIFLANCPTKVIISNRCGSTRYYGMRTLDCIFQILLQEFPNKIEAIIVNIHDDYSALITARRLGYQRFC